MDSLTIVDPGRLRVPFGGGNRTPRKQSWMTVSNPSCTELHCENNSLNAVQCSTNMQDVVMDIPRQSNIKLSLEPIMQPAPNHILPGRQSSEHHWEIKGWILSLGYSVFGLSLALCNLFSSAQTSRVCTILSPIPMACLLLQALFCVDYGMRQRNTTYLEVWCLVVSALIIPTVCVSWSLYMSVPLTLFLSLSAVSCVRQRGVLVWVCLSGVFLSLVVVAPTPILHFIEPKWGMTVALFFLGVLCFLAGMNSGGVEMKIKYF
jgi:hypothetical protein